MSIKTVSAANKKANEQHIKNLLKKPTKQSTKEVQNFDSTQERVKRAWTQKQGR
ncbi:MAG: hypothetical protein FWG87_11425 [Defluviitaleaceae bacterium]|nr:hypothetical protein [Defluviitaleaceae bacterium]